MFELKALQNSNYALFFCLQLTRIFDKKFNKRQYYNLDLIGFNETRISIFSNVLRCENFDQFDQIYGRAGLSDLFLVTKHNQFLICHKSHQPPLKMRR